MYMCVCVYIYTHTHTHTPNTGAPQYIRQMLIAIKGEIDSNTIRVGSLTPHLHQWTDHPDRKSIRKHRPYMTH